MKYKEYRGRKEGKTKKNTSTADMRNPGPREGEQAEGLGEKHSRAKEEAWGGGGEEVKIVIPDEADETAEEGKLNKFTESTEAKIESCSHFFPTETQLSSQFNKWKNKTFK